MDSDEDLDVDGEGEGKESESGQTTASLTGFLFGNIDKEGKLEDTYLDEVYSFTKCYNFCIDLQAMDNCIRNHRFAHFFLVENLNCLNDKYQYCFMFKINE